MEGMREEVIEQRKEGGSEEQIRERERKKNTNKKRKD